MSNAKHLSPGEVISARRNAGDYAEIGSTDCEPASQIRLIVPDAQNRFARSAQMPYFAAEDAKAQRIPAGVTTETEKAIIEDVQNISNRTKLKLPPQRKRIGIKIENSSARGQKFTTLKTKRDGSISN